MGRAERMLVALLKLPDQAALPPPFGGLLENMADRFGPGVPSCPRRFLSYSSMAAFHSQGEGVAGGSLAGHELLHPSQRPLDGRPDRPYTDACLLAIARTGTAMKPTRVGNRVVVIGSTPPASEKTAYPPPVQQRPTTRRIVVIRNNEPVGRTPGR